MRITNKTIQRRWHRIWATLDFAMFCPRKSRSMVLGMILPKQTRFKSHMFKVKTQSTNHLKILGILSWYVEYRRNAKVNTTSKYNFRNMVVKIFFQNKLVSFLKGCGKMPLKSRDVLIKINITTYRSVVLNTKSWLCSHQFVAECWIENLPSSINWGKSYLIIYFLFVKCFNLFGLWYRLPVSDIRFSRT